MKAIDEAKVKEITSRGYLEDINDLNNIIKTLQELPDVPAEAWTLEVGEE